MMRYSLFLRDEGFDVVDLEATERDHLATASLTWEPQAIHDLLGEFEPSHGLALVLDFSDESMHYEWVPKLFPWERPALEKRLKSRFEKSAFVHAHWLPVFQKNAEGREEQLILLANASHSPKLDMLLGLIEEFGLALRQVYSYTFLMEAWFLKRLARRIGLKGKRLKQPFILTVRETERRFRQFVLIESQLRMTRNIELDDVLDEAECSRALADETRATLRYLYNQKLVPFNHEVGQVYLDGYGQAVSPVMGALRASLVSTNWDRSRLILKGESLGGLGLAPSAPDEKRTLMCLVQFLKTAAPASFYRNAYTDRVGRLWQWNRLTWLSWALVALLGSYALLQTAIDYFVLTDKAEQVMVKQQQFEQDKQRLQSVIHLQYDAEDMKATVEFFDQLKRVKQHGSVGRELAALSRVVNRHPAIELTEIRWNRHPILDEERVQVWLSGYVKGNQRYEVLLQKADAFMAGIREDSRVEQLKYVNEPLNRNAAQALAVEGRLERKTQELPFSLTYRLKVFEPLTPAPTEETP
jgi:hypothetical protein